MKIYLAGPIRGLTYEQACEWREDVEHNLTSLGHTCSSPMRGKEILKTRGKITNSYEEFPISSEAGIYGRDIFDVSNCDVLLANFLGAKDASLGTAMEVQAAHDRGKYVLVVMEEGNVHDHPFIRRAASLVVRDIDTALDVLAVLGGPYGE